jgi:hypothetical protein
MILKEDCERQEAAEIRHAALDLRIRPFLKGAIWQGTLSDRLCAGIEG